MANRKASSLWSSDPAEGSQDLPAQVVHREPIDEQPRRQPTALWEHGQEAVLPADVLVAQGGRLPERALEDLLRPRAERNVSGRDRAGPAAPTGPSPR